MSESDFDDSKSIEKPVEEIIKEVETKNLEGNQNYKSGNLSEAYELYKKASEQLSVLDNKNLENLASLYKKIKSNLSLTALKTKNFRECIEFTTELIDKYGYDDKLYYRRAMAYLEISNYDETEADISVMKKNNHESADNLLLLVKKKREHEEILLKNRFKSIFSNSTNLYEDKEKERNEIIEKERIESLKLKEEYDKLLKEKKIDEKVSFNEWSELKKHEKDEEIEKKQKEIASRVLPSYSPNETDNKKSTVVSSKSETVNLDEQESIMLNEIKNKGYRYFKGNTTKEDKFKVSADYIPKKIDDVEVKNPELQRTISGRKGVSDWNISGATYEETDFTDSCKKILTESLENIEHKNFKITKLSAITGSAHTMLVRSVVKHYFDFSFNLEIKLERENETVNLTYEIQEMNTMNAKSSIDEGKFTQKIKLSQIELSEFEQFKQLLRERVDAFVDKFNNL